MAFSKVGPPEGHVPFVHQKEPHQKSAKNYWATLRLNSTHKTITNHNRIHSNHRHLNITRLTFAHDDCHPVTRQSIFNSLRSFFCLTLDNMLTATGLGNLGERSFFTRISRLIAGRAIAAVIYNQEYVVICNIIGNRWQRTQVGQY